MPIRKFRDVAEMEGNTWHEKGDPRLFAAIRAVWDLAARTRVVRFPPGVYKHRSIEDATRLRLEWEKQNIEAIRERRRSAQTRK